MKGDTEISGIGTVTVLYMRRRCSASIDALFVGIGDTHDAGVTTGLLFTHVRPFQVDAGEIWLWSVPDCGIPSFMIAAAHILGR